MIDRRHSAAGRWVPPGEPVTVGAHAIPHGLIYVGRHLPSASGSPDPALVNPDLPIAMPGGRGFDLGTGPDLAYHLLSPVARRDYLAWLESGRSLDVAPGLVLLFCFGLERRVLLDPDHDPAVRRELPALAAEVSRLRRRYDRGGRTLQGALDNLLDLLALLGAERTAPLPSAVRTTPMAVRLGLARFALAGEPVPADWARAWIRHHPAHAPRSAEVNCPAEFDRLFALRYHDRHGAGLVPPEDVPGVRLRYQPASPSLSTTLVCREDLPDVLAEPRSTRVLGALVDEVAAALNPYRRWLARFPEGRGSLTGATLLPPELVDSGHGRIGALRVWAERQLDGQARALVDAAEFWGFWSTAAPQRMARDEAAGLFTVLALLDFGVEPDVRFGAPALAPGPAMLFRLGRPASDRPSAHFPAAAAIVRCAAAVASASGPVDPRGPAATALLASVVDLAAALRLPPGEDLRLAARLGWLLTTRIDVDRLYRQTAMVTTAERETAGHYLIRVALATDPAIGPGTVAMLTRVYRILGLEPDLVFHRLHEHSVGGSPGHLPPLPPDPGGPPWSGDPDGPVVVRTADPAANGYALPWVAATSSSVRLDRDAIERKQTESRAAAALLATVFDGEPEPPHAAPVAPPPHTVAGLDVAHGELLRALARRRSWTREDFASLAAQYGVLPDGAFDVLNEVAIEVVGAPVIDEDDTLVVDHDVLMEMLA